MPFERVLGKSEGALNARKPEGGKLDAVIRRVNRQIL